MLAFAQTSSPKKEYRTPELVIYGNVTQLTLKDGPAKDQNLGTYMYWTTKPPASLPPGQQSGGFM